MSTPVTKPSPEEVSFSLWIKGHLGEAVERQYARQSPNTHVSLDASSGSGGSGNSLQNTLAAPPDLDVRDILGHHKFVEFAKYLTQVKRRRVNVAQRYVYVLEQRLRFKRDWDDLAKELGHPVKSLGTECTKTKGEYLEWLFLTGVTSRNWANCPSDEKPKKAQAQENHNENDPTTTTTEEEPENGNK